METINCRKYSDEILNDIKISKEDKDKINLKVIRLGNKKSDLSYEKSLKNTGKKIGINVKVDVFSKDIPESILLEEIKKCNTDESISGIMVFRPLPSNIDEDKLINTICPEKDVDGANHNNVKNSILPTISQDNLPATARAIHYVLFKELLGNLSGKDILIINRSLVIGKPLSMLLLDEDASVTIAHSKTRNINEKLRKKDIIISAVGRGEFLSGKYIDDNTYLVDLGIDYSSGFLQGDFIKSTIEDRKVSYIPPIGGIGAVTTAIIMKQTYDNYIKKVDKE